MSTDMPLAPFVQQGPELHDAHWLLGAGELITIRVPAEATGGHFSVTEHQADQGAEVPLHRQSSEDETWYVIEGGIAFWFDDAEDPVSVGAGGLVVARRGVAHGWRVVSPSARWITVHTPGGHEGFFRAVGEPATDLSIPPLTPPGPDALAELMTACRDYNVELLGEPPTAD